MEVIAPTLGYFVWALIIFLLFFLLLSKFAWKPILGALKEREETIESSLQEAQKAKEEMQNLKSENEQLLHKARKEREEILKEANLVKEQIIGKAKEEAGEESARMIANAKEEIQSEKMRALTDIKNQVGVLSLEIAEKILKEELSDKSKQEKVIDNLISEIHLN